MASRLFQSLILQMKESLNRTIGVIDFSGTIIASSDLTKIGETWEKAIFELSGKNDIVFCDNYTFKAFAGDGTKGQYAIFAEGVDENARNICTVAAVALNGTKQYYDEKYDKATFIKNILLDNILPSDIHMKAKEMQFVNDVTRTVFVIRVSEKSELEVMEVARNLFPDKQKDFVINISDNEVALVKEVKPTVEEKDLKKIAKSLEDTINSELMVKSKIGIGSIVNNIKNIARSFKEGQIAIDVGSVFDADKTVLNYKNLGIGRLIYQLPTTLCEMFISEVFKQGAIENLDQETLLTIQKFFENNLNVSETSRKLFVHRNTLVYRLEKIKKITGLDLREFDHAIIFKVALMVKKYLSSRDDNQSNQ